MRGGCFAAPSRERAGLVEGSGTRQDAQEGQAVSAAIEWLEQYP